MHGTSPVEVMCLGPFAFRPILTIFLSIEKICLSEDLIFFIFELRTGQEKEMDGQEERVHL